MFILVRVGYFRFLNNFDIFHSVYLIKITYQAEDAVKRNTCSAEIMNIPAMTAKISTSVKF